MADMTIRGLGRRLRLSGSVTVPGDAAISQRAAILGALAAGTTVIGNCARGRDVQSLLGCLTALGAGVQRHNGAVTIEGVGGPGLAEPADVLDCGSSASAMRLLAGALAGQPFLSVLNGNAALRRRPMRRVLEPLARMGARTWGRDYGCHAPIVIHGGLLEGLGRYRPAVASEHVKSGLLLAGLAARGETAVIEPAPTPDHTERLLGLFGAVLAREPAGVSSVRGPQALRGAAVKVPGDFSLAAAWLVLGAAAPAGSELTVIGVGLNPRRTALLGILERMGAEVDVVLEASDPEPIGSVRVRGGELRGVEVGRHELPALRDELPLLLVAAALARGRTVIRGGGGLDVGEPAVARIVAAAGNLRAMGATVEEQGGSLVIDGTAGRLLHGAAIVAGEDQPVALACTVAALLADGESSLDGAGDTGAYCRAMLDRAAIGAVMAANAGKG